MTFECVKKYGKHMEKWFGRITTIKNYGSHTELRIESRSSILVLIGQTTSGHFACMPDFGQGCYLADFNDLFWNTERLTAALGKIDGITVAYALLAASNQLKTL